MKVSLTPELEKFVTEEVRSGKYSSAEEVIGEGLRLLRERKEQAANGEMQTEPVQTKSPQAEKALNWLAEHRQEYLEQIVALDGDRLLAHGTDARAVYLAARRAGVEVPSLIHVRERSDLPFGGW